MQHLFNSLGVLLGTLLCALSAAYATAAAVARPHAGARARRGKHAATRGVSVFKPLCGAEPRLAENLATLCRQTHPCYQLLFGVRDPQDPAIEVVEQLRTQFPAHEIVLVTDSRVYGSNLKVSNLMNLLPYARYDDFVLADSDIAVGPDYLERVCAPLADASVGIVTCLYSARALAGFWTRIGALFVDTWFIPSVRVASLLGFQCFGFGATIALRRDALAVAGGFEALRNRLADDYWLGQLTREQGLRTVISEYCVATDVTEQRYAAMWARELRWLRTIRAADPVGFAFTFVTFTFPMLITGLALARSGPALGLAITGALARLSLHWRRPAADLPPARDALLAPLRDTLLFVQWAIAFCGTQVQWRGQTLSARNDAAQSGVTQTTRPSDR